jgi:hypothetical protein
MPTHRFLAFAAMLPLVAGCTATVVTGQGGDGAGGGDVGASNVGDTTGTGGSGGSAPASCPDPAACTLGVTQMSCCGEGYEYGCIPQTCVLVSGCPQWDATCWTPLVISFDDAPVEYRADRAHAFQLSSAGPTPTDWPTAKTPWLALDRNGNGSIDDGSELFGSMTMLADGRRAAHGFEALRALDFDGNGLIDERDPAFAELGLWSDRDGDRRSGAGELATVSQAGIVSIDLRYRSDPRCDGRGNCEVERAPIVYRDASGSLRTGSAVDIHLAAQR